jgi:hypothetical protein
MARASRNRSFVWFVSGLLVGVLLVSPASAHVGTSITHLWNIHLRPLADARYVNLGEKATNADKLDGKDSTAFQDALSMQICPQGTTAIGVGPAGGVLCTQGRGPAAPAPVIDEASVTLDESDHSVAYRIVGTAPPNSYIRFYVPDNYAYTCGTIELWELVDLFPTAHAGPDGSFEYLSGYSVDPDLWPFILSSFEGAEVEVDASPNDSGGAIPLTLCSEPTPLTVVEA